MSLLCLPLKETKTNASYFLSKEAYPHLPMPMVRFERGIFSGAVADFFEVPQGYTPIGIDCPYFLVKEGELVATVPNPNPFKRQFMHDREPVLQHGQCLCHYHITGGFDEQWKEVVAASFAHALEMEHIGSEAIVQGLALQIFVKSEETL